MLHDKEKFHQNSTLIDEMGIAQSILWFIKRQWVCWHHQRACTQNSIFFQLPWSCPKTWLTTTRGTYYNSFALLHPGVSRDSHFAESSSCTALFYGALTFGPTRLGATHLFGFKAVLYPSDREIQAGWQQSFQEMNKKMACWGPAGPGRNQN